MTIATSATTIAPKHLLKVSDLTREQFEGLLELAVQMKSDPLGWRNAQGGKALACFFSKPSTRTRVSLEVAAQRLGMLPLMLRPDELQLGRGEPIADTARVLSGYVDAIAVRTFAQADVNQLAGAARVPVINALTDEHHPCQALADLLTIKEHFGASRRAQARLRRRRQQRRPFADGSRGAVRHGDRPRQPARLPSARRGSDLRPRPSRAARRVGRCGGGSDGRRQRRAGRSIPTSGCRWARMPSAPTASPPSTTTRSRPS